MALKPISIGSALLLGTLLMGCSPTDPVPAGDTTPPTVSLSAALTAVASGASTTLTATATDDTAVTKVEFYNGATKLSEDTTAPYTAVVTVAGTTTYTATAYDAAGNTASATTTVNVAAGTGSVQGTVVDQNIGAPVAGSTITVMQGGVDLGTFTTGADGSFVLPSLAAGSYDIKARKDGMAGSDIYGLVVNAGAATPLTLVQRPAFETSANPTPAKLILTRENGSPLAGATFTNTVDFRIKTAPDSDHVPPIRIMYAQIGRTPGSGGITASNTANNWNFAPPSGLVGQVDSGAVTVPNASFPNFVAGLGSAAGENLYLNVLVVDYNYNYSRYVVPIKLINTAATAGNTVEAPTRAAATAYTLRQEGSWTTPYSVDPEGNAAPNGSGVFVEVRWCYTNVTAAAKPFAFDIERSSDGTTFTKIGTVGGASVATCSATNQQARPYNYRDTSSELAAGKTFTYRVLARGANSVASNTTQTTPLAQFTPTFIAPADESTGVSIDPTFVMGQNQTAIGADGAAYNLRLRDLMTLNGYNLPGAAANALIRVEEGTGDTGNKVPTGQSLVFLSTSSILTPPTSAGSILTDTSGKYLADRPNLFPVDTAAHTVSIPLNILTGVSLQTLRPYKWEMYSGFAYKYAPSEGNRISAYSVYTWPDSTVAPINQTRGTNINWDFITGEK